MKHVALLRAVNVGGHRRVQMSDLRVAFEGLGYAEVQTYIQSDNVVFEADAPELSAIEKKFGFHVAVLLRNAAEWASLPPRHPYPQEQDGTHLHVASLNAVPAQGATILAVPGNTWQVSGREIYLHTPQGMGKSGPNLGKLKDTTARNWRTVEKLGELLA